MTRVTDVTNLLFPIEELPVLRPTGGSIASRGVRNDQSWAPTSENVRREREKD
jgi:hypothetical protein